jgi:hypothetical protein
MFQIVTVNISKNNNVKYSSDINISFYVNPPLVFGLGRMRSHGEYNILNQLSLGLRMLIRSVD